MSARLISLGRNIAKNRCSVVLIAQPFQSRISSSRDMMSLSNRASGVLPENVVLPKLRTKGSRLDSFELSYASVACIQLTQRRNISQSFHSNYLSPEFPPIGFAQGILETVHSTVGLPWWASIAFATVALRTVVTLPMMIYSLRNVAKVELLQPEIKVLAQELTAEIKRAQMERKWSKRIAQYHFKWNMKRIVRDLYIRDNCHPSKEYILPWVQIPLWISVSLALRNMAGALPVEGVAIPVLCPDLALGGTLWFVDLLVPDSTFLLPFVMCLANLTIIEMQNLRVENPKRFQRFVTYFLRGLTVVVFPIAASVPSCMCLYWMCSSLCGLGQNVLLKIPKVRRFFGIPKTPSESQQPFRDLLRVARERYSLRKKPPSLKNSQEKV